MRLTFFAPVCILTCLVAQTPPKPSGAVNIQMPAFTNSLGMRFVRIPAGSFQMGGTEKGEGPVHKVTFAKPFFIGACQVTQPQWKALMGTTPSKFPGDERPVDYVNWHEAKAFVAALNAMDQGANEYALPTEAEWEYACRAGSTGAFSVPDAQVGEVAWFDANAGDGTHPVGKKKPNAWGMYDMHGNVWEWCEDVWHDDYQGAPTDGSAWSSGGDASKRVIRGGSWAFGASDARCASRMAFKPENRVCDSLGIRVVIRPK